MSSKLVYLDASNIVLTNFNLNALIEEMYFQNNSIMQVLWIPGIEAFRVLKSIDVSPKKNL
jgi:hypothetical protein